MKLYKDKVWLHSHYYIKELSTTEMSDLAGCSQSTIICWMKKYGYGRRSNSEAKKGKKKIDFFKGWSNEEIKDWLHKKYYDEELNTYEMAELAGCTPTTIRRWMDKYSYERRSRSKVNSMIMIKYYETHDGYWKDKKNPKHSERMSGKNNPMYGKDHTEKSKHKLRKSRAKQILPKKDTSIEIIMHEILDELKLNYETHIPILDIEDCYNCDILVGENLIIEYDGNYWHNYPDGREIDHIRDKELEKAGYKVLRFWGSEIRNNKNKVKKKILEEV